MNRRHDVVLYGASGFVGRQTVAYFAAHAPSGLRWAIAGRDRAKLEAVRAQTGAEVLVADGRDRGALAAVAAQARVVLSTAGPFALYGSALVDACVAARTHYVDISGETPWVRDLIDRHHERAARAGIRLVPCCGFDSVPSDLGAWLVARHMREELGAECARVKACFRFYGGFNGGTLATALNLLESGQARRARDPFLLDPPGAHGAVEIAAASDPALPRYDADIGAWVGPYFMGPINTRVVRRSCALLAQWQPDDCTGFDYQEYIRYEPPLAWLQAATVTAGLGLFQAALASPLRRLLAPLLPQPGSGPSERTMNRGWFRCELVALARDGRSARGVVADRGDPGNRVTVKCLCEAALALALESDALPGGSGRGGVLTPVTGLGEVLVRRLRAAGMTLQAGTRLHDDEPLAAGTA